MSPATEAEIRQTNRIFEEEVVARRDVGALDRVYTADATILPPGADTVTGRENIKQFWAAAIARLNVSSVQMETVSFDVAADTGFEIGRATLHFPADAPDVSVKYVVVWKREDGTWKWHIDIWNMNP